MSDENINLILSKLDNIDVKFEKKFDQIDDKFDKVDKRFEQIDEKFKKIDERFEQIDKKFEKIDKRFEQIDSRFDDLRGDLEKSLKEDLEKVIIDRFFVFEQRFERAISLLLETLNDRNEEEQIQNERITRLEKNMGVFRAFTIRQEEKVANMETGMLKWYQDNPEVPKLF